MSFEYSNEEEYCYSQWENCNNEEPAIELERSSSYLIFKEDQLMKERDFIIKQAMNFTESTIDEAILILIYFKWSMEKLNDTWYDDPDGYKIKCGIKLSDSSRESLKRKKLKENNLDCLVCYDPIDLTSNFKSLVCNHNFCSDCWKEYLKVKSEDALNCLSTPCLQESCNLLIPESFFFHYFKEIALEYKEPNIKEKFMKNVSRNFTIYNSDMKICPNLNCNYCIKCDIKAAKEIKCLCGYNFCFKCYKETHRPCSCELLSQWEIRSKSDTDNDKWIKANTKTCPHCKQKIEKSQGCNYMLCHKKAGGCGLAFCYVCEQDWAKHSQDHFNCNMYSEQVKEKENEANQLKVDLQRYYFYFDRYINYNNATKFAEKLLPKLEELILNITKIKLLPLAELEFILQALQTVILGKRTLKYTYIFGYYLKDGHQKKLFEFSQGYLERNSDQLHQMIEQDSLRNIVSEENYDIFTKNFSDFKNSIINLTQATIKYQNNLLNDIEINCSSFIDEKYFK